MKLRLHPQQLQRKKPQNDPVPENLRKLNGQAAMSSPSFPNANSLNSKRSNESKEEQIPIPMPFLSHFFNYFTMDFGFGPGLPNDGR